MSILPLATVVLAAALIGATLWIVRDYRAWLALGPGGLPSSWAGWWRMTRWRMIARDPLELAPVRARSGSAHDVVTLDALPSRAGARPRVSPHPVPHRQLTDHAPDAVKALLNAAFDARVAADTARLVWRKSHFEKHNDAVTLRPECCAHADACTGQGEVGHIHPSDGSMHMILSPSDTQAVIVRGWGERHALGGIAAGLPLTYTLIYAPRDAEEVAVIGGILDAAITYLARIPVIHKSISNT